MIRKLISISCFLSMVTAVSAQIPHTVSVEGRAGVQVRAPQACNEAGTIRYGLHTGQSNDVGGRVIYLCAGDSMRILHNQDFDLMGDPNTSTPAGIGYVFYDCQPTAPFAGPDLATIKQDPCLNQTSPIIINGNPVPLTGDSLWIATDQRNGDILLTNTGLLQNAYKGGAPVQFWFAPITIDNFAGRRYENGGACVDVNTDVAFSVVYLNPVQVSDVNISAGANGCVGSFVVNGGLPEFDPNANYQIRISKEDDPTVLAQTNNAAPDAGDTIRFFVPEPGVYVITVEDGKSCSATTTADMSNCQAVAFSLPFRNARPGDNVCLDVTVKNFRDVSLFQGTLTWDPAVLRYSGVQGLHPQLANSQETFEALANDTLTFLWFDPLRGVTLADDEVIFQVCFDIVGVLGQSSPVRFIDQPTPIEVGDSQDQRLGFITQDGQVNVSNDILFVDIRPDSVSCPGLRDGSITVRVAQGTPNYRVTWDTLPQTGSFLGPLSIPDAGGAVTIPNLPGGEYVVRIEDSSTPNSIVFTDTVRVAEALTLGSSILETQPVCFGESTGSVRVRVTVGGIAQNNLSGYSFRWNVTTQNVPRLDSVASGPYAVTVTDPRGCTATASTTLSQPAPITIDPTFTNPSCSGATNGGIVARAAGGNTANGQYTYQWDSLGTFVTDVSTVTGLTEGEYVLTIIDDNGCSHSEILELSSDKTLSINEVVTDITCNGAANGEIFLTGATTGAPADLPYTFTWQGPGIPAGDSDQGNDSRRANLAAGTFTVTMTDNDPAGCQVVGTYTLTDPAPIAITLTDKTDETCVVGNDGAARLSVTGGTPPYRFAWVDSNRDTVAADSLASGLSAGRYAAQITDLNGCLDSLEVFINAPTPPQIQPIANDTLLCNGDSNGALSVSASPGNAPINGYRWSNGLTGQSITGLRPGVYYVTVTAEDGCASVDSALVVAPAPLMVDSIVAASPTCAGDSDGSLTVFASGGTMPYTYIWQNTPRNDTLRFNLYPGLAAGAYTVTIVDGNNCESVTGSGTVADPPSIVVTFTDTVAVSCFDNICDGRATANAVYSDGASGLFNFSWVSGETAATVSSSAASQLCAGDQAVTVTDAKQCFTVATVTIPSPPEIVIEADIEPVTCNGRADGQATLSVSGGVPGYTILWVESGATTNAITNLAAGAYSAVVTDSKGCNKSQRVTISEPAALQLTLDTNETEDPSCNGSTDGVIAVIYNAADSINPLGAAPYTWSGGAAGPDSPIATGLRAGTYSVTLTDVKGCQDSLSVTLNEPSPIIAVIPDPADPRCFGESTVLLIDTIYGGNGVNLLDYMYQLNNSGLTFTPDQPATIFAGQTIITIEDPKGCTLVDTINVDQPEELTVTFDPDIVVIELGDSTIRLNPIITSSLPIDTYLWSPATGLSSSNVQRPIVDSLFNNQEYNLTVTDVNGCVGMGSVFVRIDKNRNVYIPNVFSPNGDGPNDEFRIFACKGVRNIRSARIFDRWGGILFESNETFTNCEGGTVIWDGRRGSREMPTGVYVYMIEIEFIDGITLLYRGDVTLLR